MRTELQFQKHKQHSQLSNFAFRHASQIFLFFCLFLFLSSARALNPDTVVSVDHRVTVSYSIFKYDPQNNTYTTKVSIKINSEAPIFAPLRLTISRIENPQIRLLNTSGLGPGRLPYREIPLTHGVLSAGQTTELITLVFIIENEKIITTASRPF